MPRPHGREPPVAGAAANKDISGSATHGRTAASRTAAPVDDAAAHIAWCAPTAVSPPCCRRRAPSLSSSAARGSDVAVPSATARRRWLASSARFRPPPRSRRRRNDGFCTRRCVGGPPAAKKHVVKKGREYEAFVQLDRSAPLTAAQSMGAAAGGWCVLFRSASHRFQKPRDQIRASTWSDLTARRGFLQPYVHVAGADAFRQSTEVPPPSDCR
jgi:hypothetical protein